MEEDSRSAREGHPNYEPPTCRYKGVASELAASLKVRLSPLAIARD